MILAQSWTVSLSATVLLAAVATLGYLFGRRRQESSAGSRDNMRHEIMRALAVAQELETIAYRLRKNMALHVPAIVRFNNRLHRWERSGEISWHELCNQADELLKPALRLSTEISHAHADLLQQMTHLSMFAELSTDPLTGVSNRRAFDDSLVKLLAEHEGSKSPLSIAMLDLDHFKRINDQQGHLAGDRVLQDLTQLLKVCLREGDILARYGGEEFVVIMPQTPLRSAGDLAQRMRARIEGKLATTISIGVAANTASETATSLLSRADAAMYTAKNQGRNCVCLHEGSTGRIVTIRTTSAAPADEKPAADDNPAPQADSSAPPDADHPEVSVLHGEGRPCISCNYCEEVCPAGIMPHLIHKHLYADDIEEADATRVDLCVECGLCSYVCPSKIDLMNQFVEAKKVISAEQEEVRKEQQRQEELRQKEAEQESAEEKNL